MKAILDGERNSYKLAELRDRRVKATKEQIARSLEGNWQDDLLFILRQEQEAYEFCETQIGACDRELKQSCRSGKTGALAPSWRERSGRTGARRKEAVSLSSSICVRRYSG